MKGVYIHIPFCRQACRYCDFYFTVSLKYADSFVDCLLSEIRQRSMEGLKGFEESSSTRDNRTGSLYLGGGTPSLLSGNHLLRITEAVREVFDFSPEAEWTIECNPDDIHPAKLEDWRNMGFNRLSIGVQSFLREDLVLLRRSHNEQQAREALMAADGAGFKNLTVDLIYGIPGQTSEQWAMNLEQATELPVSHLSAYHLTFEPGTVLEHWRKRGRIAPVPEEQSLESFRILRNHMGNLGFEHYEISNFAKPGMHSRHNMVYWTGKPYLGFGPSAHSYDGDRRRWNIASLKKYMDGIRGGKVIHEQEILSPADKYHDYLITSLRTGQGVNAARIGEIFGERFLEHFEKESALFLREGSMIRKDEKVWIDPAEWLITDRILEQLFMDEVT